MLGLRRVLSLLNLVAELRVRFVLSKYWTNYYRLWSKYNNNFSDSTHERGYFECKMFIC